MAKSTFIPEEFTILMVDDLPKNIQVLGSTLKNQNYNLEFATSGEKALDWLEKKAFDLILLDLMMPGMDGFDVCKAIRMNKKYEDMPIIFLTAKTDKETTVRGFEVGGQDYITKPFDSGELLARVKTQLELRQSKQKINNLNRWLEKTVEERTRELNLANKELTEANKNLNQLSEDLISLDAEKAEFMQIISHEIRTPLNSIKGFLGLIRDKINDKKILNYFDYIDKSSYRLEKFAVQALLITELRINRYAVKKDQVDVKNFIDRLLKSQFNKEITEKRVNIVLDFSPEDIQLKADHTLFIKGISSIIENALHYCNVEGRITFKGYNSNSGVNIEITDDGSGFSERALKNLGNLFVPGEEHINKNKGVDLAIVCLIMENHHGTLQVVNNPEGGATVKLFFPINEQ